MSEWDEVPVLAGKHVTLRSLEREDRIPLLQAFEGLEDLFYTTVPSEPTIDGWFDQLERERNAGRAAPFTVLDAEGRVSGTTRFLRMNRRHRRLEIGGTLYAPRVQRTGLNTEAKRLLLSYAFDVLECVCVQIRTDFLNRNSRRGIERLGARLDGVLRSHMIMPSGHRRDTVVYSIIDSDWPGVRRNLDHLLAGRDSDHGRRSFYG
jgi:RimJ/RimL family protein N-acetyltransferase